LTGYYHQQLAYAPPAHHQSPAYPAPAHQPSAYPPPQQQELSAYWPGETAEGRQIPDLADHTTYKPFAYEPPPLAPLSGMQAVDRTIEDIHIAFIEGDPQGFDQGLHSRS
jgi:hypothetical protein